jgi:hypothetical protein
MCTDLGSNCADNVDFPGAEAIALIALCRAARPGHPDKPQERWFGKEIGTNHGLPKVAFFGIFSF